MTHPSSFPVNPSWRILLNDLGLRGGDILRRGGLPGDLFARDKATLSTEEYFRLWRALEEETADPTLPLRIGLVLTVESFDPPVFAALCSSNLNVALGRIAHYKRLVMPMRLRVKISAPETTLDIEWLDAQDEVPPSLVGMELVYFVQLARIATRHRVTPLEVTSPRSLESEEVYSEYFGVPLSRANRVSITFSAEDATRPFLTANERMWDFFEPDLRRRLSELDERATTSERVRVALLDLLPSGEASMTVVAKRLGTSTRTLQRRLKQEGVSFQAVLNATREELATHYLKSSSYSGAEISFLLGFDDPNSFFRAFHSWTGTTPEKTRSALQMS